MKKIVATISIFLLVIALVSAGWWLVSSRGIDHEPTSQTHQTRVPLNIVLLGDSYASGNGAGDYSDENCWRSPHNYGTLVVHALNAKFTDASCSSAKMANLTSQEQKFRNFSHATATYRISEAKDQWAQWLKIAKSHGICASEQANITVDITLSAQSQKDDKYTATAWCSGTNQPQLNAITDRTDVVLVSIGGNDAGFAQIAGACLTARSARLCDAALTRAQDYVSNSMHEALTKTLASISDRTSGKANIFIVGYPTLLADTHYTIGGKFSQRVNVGQRLTHLQDSADEAAKRAASEAGANVHFVSTRHALGEHSFDPESSENSWIIAPFDTWNIREYFHPNRAGWKAIADVVEDAVRSKLSSRERDAA
ncbi:SGNH/GDSL hydrolase family protein [Arcanobacterium canis]|uniref:SGNH/GDSL hydrolase family protein n=1 Tax=Arcanobacterium canis TaxID=999183 RepID=A0ABY8FWM9_9ACTO|nr:SGNH/GDSL hydrolase family protein [Arcanobacterium canis]WFM82927.1 SGNH/GDSL hydrolase family protein [Arcanobacterium canis]